MEFLSLQKEQTCDPVKFYINIFCFNLDNGVNDDEKTTFTIAGIAIMVILSLSMFKLSFSTRLKIKKMK